MRLSQNEMSLFYTLPEYARYSIECQIIVYNELVSYNASHISSI